MDTLKLSTLTCISSSQLTHLTNLSYRQAIGPILNDGWMYRSIDEWFYGMVPVRAAVCKACKLELACLERGALGKSPSSLGPVALGVQGLQVHLKIFGRYYRSNPFSFKQLCITMCTPRLSGLPLVLQAVLQWSFFLLCSRGLHTTVAHTNE